MPESRWGRAYFWGVLGLGALVVLLPQLLAPVVVQPSQVALCLLLAVILGANTLLFPRVTSLGLVLRGDGLWMAAAAVGLPLRLAVLVPLIELVRALPVVPAPWYKALFNTAAAALAVAAAGMLLLVAGPPALDARGVVAVTGAVVALEVVNVAVFSGASTLFVGLRLRAFLAEAWRKSPLSLQTWALGGLIGVLILEHHYAAFALVAPLLVTTAIALAGEKAREDLRRDRKTGVLTLGAFQAEVSRMRRTRRQDSPVQLVMLDIDHFREVNRVHGHLAGDEVLVGIADILQREVREVDLCGRFGGEEFVLALRGLTTTAAADACERLRALVAATDFARPDGGAISVTASFGLAQLRDDDLTASLAAADRCLYIAKESGRNRVVGEEQGRLRRSVIRHP